MIRVVLPYHLRNLARVDGEVQVRLASESGSESGSAASPPTLGAALTALEEQFPVLRGTIRDQTTQRRRPFVRYFLCKQDWSHEPLETSLPPEVLSGQEPLLIVGAMAGG
jgi:hypothetical protein